jgi:hypothetical protein
MAISAKYSIQYSASATPIEEIFGNNSDSGTNSSRLVHSDIDKSFGGSRELACGTNAAYIKNKSYLTTTGTVLLNDSTIIGAFINAEFLMIVIKSAGSTGTPDCKVEISNGSAWVEVCKLKKVNDSMLLPLTAKNLSQIRISSSASTTLANVEILVGKD